MDPTFLARPETSALPAAPAGGRLPVTFCVAVAGLLVAAFNGRFWRETFALSDPHALTDWLFMASLFVVLVAAHASVLLMIPGRRVLKAVAIALVIAGAIGAYFADTYGVTIDRDMMRNVLQTDSREALALVSLRLLTYVLLLGLGPAVFIARARVRATGWRRDIAQRTVFIAGAVLVCFACVALMGARYASFIREHKNLRQLITPGNVVYGSALLLKNDSFASGSTRVIDLESPVSRVAPTARKPLVLFLVIGETARARNFQLGGYARQTNPELARRHVDYFSSVSSCGTSTAVSLPCMFTGVERNAFNGAVAARSTNLVDALVKGGIAVEWRDNNSGCKGICARVPTVSYAGAADAKLCTASGCYDEVMLADLPQTLAKIRTDTVIVFHQAGSHGPDYSQRYPREFERFKPVCRGIELDRCGRQEVVNAYDNSLSYTDFNIARQIDALASASSTIDGLLLYVSDHGESLGEHGLYLHGAPYLFAPDEQTQVPMLMWMSPGYRERAAISGDCVARRTTGAYTHANLYHTVLGTFGVRSARYRPAMDILASCRAGSTIAD